MGRAAFLWISIYLLCGCIWQDTARAVTHPCSACTAVSNELSRRLNNERERNHIDLRHRLDRDGNRYGKVIEYRISELRALELLDGLCRQMSHYRLSAGSWTDSRLGFTEPAGLSSEEQRQLREEEKLEMTHYCERLIEINEDSITDVLRESNKTDDVQGFLCGTVTQACSSKIDARTEL